MANLSFTNIGITGLAAAVPKNTIDNYNYTLFFDKNDVSVYVIKLKTRQERLLLAGLYFVNE